MTDKKMDSLELVAELVRNGIARPAKTLSDRSRHGNFADGRGRSCGRQVSRRRRAGE